MSGKNEHIEIENRVACCRCCCCLRTVLCESKLLLQPSDYYHCRNAELHIFFPRWLECAYPLNESCNTGKNLRGENATSTYIEQLKSENRSKFLSAAESLHPNNGGRFWIKINCACVPAVAVLVHRVNRFRWFISDNESCAVQDLITHLSNYFRTLFSDTKNSWDSSTNRPRPSLGKRLPQQLATSFKQTLYHLRPSECSSAQMKKI